MSAQLKKFWLLGLVGVLIVVIFGATISLIYMRQHSRERLVLIESREAELADIVLGEPTSPHEVIMYFALDCAHCREFEQTVLPQIRKIFIETGQVRFILRDFPLGPAGLLASKIAWIRGQERYLDSVNLLLDQQETWNITDGYTTQLKKVALALGLTADEFRRCLTDRNLEDSILLRRLHAQQKDQIDSVPTFIVDGKKIDAVLSVDLLKTLLEHPGSHTRLN